ncbi:hypothetical protein [Galbibacter pacificus]|uniref:Uncharacterized protein n=1 Tax=Galbibacter pacificus TaxID=2996052 RepID=A0ABT6FVX5_9FLAO|nr:hypothetical protein [Galbibacter pacificus]MDG3584150.1 hypothetical protein [Galbibacter pacificus]MDG3587417.1 hypothetical protein [Galbibacter pacificus]
MGAPPPYRYKGSITFDYDALAFSGYDSYNKEDTVFKIQKSSITQLYYGYDEIFSTFQTRGMGISWAPIRFTIHSDLQDSETFLYVVFGFDGISSENKTLFEELKTWLS